VADAVRASSAPQVIQIERSWLARRPWVPLTAPAFALTAILLAALAVLFLYSLYSSVNGRTIEVVTLGSWSETLSDYFFWDVLWRTVQLAGLVTILNLLVGYPAAYAITQVRDRRLQSLIYVAIFSPMLVSIVVRAYGWMLLLSENGAVYYALQSIGVTEPPRLIFNLTGVVIALVHGYMPFMVFPLVGVMRQVQQVYKEAAMDLGAAPFETFRRVTLPLTLPGILAGCQIVFTLSLGVYVTPVLIGGGRVLVTARQAWEHVTNFSWPRASIEVFALLVVTVSVVFISLWLTRRTYLGAIRTRS
jgi:putative spermidine/putrescine transport system permease protein